METNYKIGDNFMVEGVNIKVVEFNPGISDCTTCHFGKDYPYCDAPTVDSCRLCSAVGLHNSSCVAFAKI